MHTRHVGDMTQPYVWQGLGKSKEEREEVKHSNPPQRRDREERTREDSRREDRRQR